MNHKVKIFEFPAILASCVRHSRLIFGRYGSGTTKGPEIAPIVRELKFYIVQAINAVMANPTLKVRGALVSRLSLGRFMVL